MQPGTLQLNDKSITLETGLPLLIGTVNGGRSVRLIAEREQVSGAKKKTPHRMMGRFLL
jgi:hypothetical protein